jgi:hypothetical protein
MATSQSCCHLPGELLNSAAECADRARIGRVERVGLTLSTLPISCCCGDGLAPDASRFICPYLKVYVQKKPDKVSAYFKQEPLKPRTYHGKIQIFMHGRF